MSRPTQRDDADEFSPESGRRADTKRAVDAIQRVADRFEQRADDLDAPDGVDRVRAFDWNDPAHREMVKGEFRENNGGEFGEPIPPGFGELGEGRNARDDCGDDYPFICDGCGRHATFGRTCSQSVCNRCAPAWARDTALQKTAKVKAIEIEKQFNTPEGENQRPHHVVLSPPLWWYWVLARAGLTLREAQDETKAIVKRLLDELRSQGMLARHSFRGADEDGSIRSEQDDRGEWSDRLGEGRDWWGDVRDELAWKPHYHAIVAGDFIRGGNLTNSLEDRTGWVIHRIHRESDNKSIPDDDALAKAVTYNLSHTDLRRNVGKQNNTQSQVWTVGSFQGDPVKRIAPAQRHYDRMEAVVLKHASAVLDIGASGTDCYAEVPIPLEVAEEMEEAAEAARDEFDAPGMTTDAFTDHLSSGRLSAHRDGSGGWEFRDPSGNLAHGEPERDDRGPLERAFDPDDGDPRDDQHDGEGCGCGHDHADGPATEECGGSLIPLPSARERGLLDDDEWREQAPHVEEADEADEEWPEDMDRWRDAGTTTPTGSTVRGVG